MSPRTVQAFRHISFEDLGSFAGPLHDAGYGIDYIDVAERDLTLVDPLVPDLLVVLGGPVGVYDDAAYPFITDEIRLLRARIDAGLPTLGICLGAQLMAAALGARVYPGPGKEIGWSRLDLAETAGANPLTALDGVAVLHWHGDTFDLPDGCERLASTPLCRNQAFARGNRVLGLQFHPEVAGARFEHWLIGHANELASACIDPVSLRRDAAQYASSLEEAGSVMLRNWLSGLAR